MNLTPWSVGVTARRCHGEGDDSAELGLGSRGVDHGNVFARLCGGASAVARRVKLQHAGSGGEDSGCARLRKGSTAAVRSRASNELLAENLESGAGCSHALTVLEATAMMAITATKAVSQRCRPPDDSSRFER